MSLNFLKSFNKSKQTFSQIASNSNFHVINSATQEQITGGTAGQSDHIIVEIMP